MIMVVMQKRKGHYGFFVKLGICLLSIIIGNLLFTGTSYAAKIGIVTDTHYDRVLYPNRATVAQNLVSIFNSEGVDLVLGLGDMYQGDFTSLDDYLQDKALYEAPYTKSLAPVRWVVGNHDAGGISISDYTNNSTYATGNSTIDISDNWRVIYYTNIEYPYFSARPATLDWLKNALAQAKTDNKKVIIATHAHIDMDYPSTPRDVFGQINFTSRVPGTVLTPSSKTGTVTVTASLPGTFTSGDKYRLLQLQHGTTWGFGMITSYIDSQTVVVSVKSAFGGTGPADSAELGGYSSVSYNADEQRAIIDAAVTSGTQVKYVFSGHASRNTQLTVNGVSYFGLNDTGDSGESSVVDLRNDSIDIAGVSIASGRTPLSYNHTTFFVDGVNGNDKNPGMIKSNAWKTLNKAKQVNTPGNYVTILPATYREYIYFRPVGSQNNPITWVYQQGAKQTCAVVVNGFSGPNVNGWFTKALATQAKEVIEDTVFLVEGTYNSAAAPGTWDWNAGILYYKPSTGIPAGHIVEAGQSNTTLQISTGASFLKIQGGEFYGCNSNGVLIQSDANNVEINGATFWGNINGLTFDSSGSNNLVTKSKFNKNNTGITVYQGNPNAAYNILTNNQTGISIGGTSYPSIFNATLYGNKYGIQIGNKGTVGPVIRNSITAANTTRGINSNGSGVSTVSSSIVSDKAYWGNTVKSNILTVNPGFVNPTGNDFNIVSTSPAVDFGIDVGLNSDYVGNPIVGLPDAGALEYQK